ncbi:MAG: hypothetical protein WCX31_22165 [Salinivirgaceae bacterium]
MKLNPLTNWTVCILMLLALNSTGQTGVFYYPLNNPEYPNSSIIDLLETTDSKIQMLNFCSSSKFTNAEIQLITIGKTGESIVTSTESIENLYNLIKLEASKPNGYRVFGNLSVNKQYVPFQLFLSQEGKEVSKTIETQIYSTLISDITSDANYYYILYTKSVKTEKFNISLNKLENSTNKVEWLKKISSEQNEEADQLVVTKTGDIYILGKKYNDESTEYVPIIYRLDNQGNQLWKKGIDVPNNFSSQSFIVSNSNEILYVCGYTKNPTGTCETRVVKLSPDGEELNSNSLTDFNANGIISLQNKNYLIFGSKFFVDQKQVITNGKFSIINDMLQEIANKTLDENDKPDIDIKQTSRTSSDFLSAIQLSDGRIAMAGRVFMTVGNETLQKQNIPLLMLINENGTYTK